MAPRNNDPSTSGKRTYTVEGNEVPDMVPCILHKKHKVVKLIKSQIQKIQREGLICAFAETQADDADGGEVELRVRNYTGGPDPHPGSRGESAEGRDAGTEGNRDGRLAGVRSRNRPPNPGDPGWSRNREAKSPCMQILIFIIEFLLLLFLMVYISAGPLSNSKAHTPIPAVSFVRTDRPCNLEKKYLLRWSRPEFTE